MEDKYYTPNIEELHFGQEIELFNNPDKCYFESGGTNEWIKASISYGVLGNMANVMRLLLDKQIRIKLLDDDDIKSLGFDHDQTTKDGAYFYFGTMMDNIHYCLNAPNARLSKGQDYTNLYIYSMNDNGNHFEGVIKNKSELARLLTQLGIK